MPGDHASTNRTFGGKPDPLAFVTKPGGPIAGSSFSLGCDAQGTRSVASACREPWRTVIDAVGGARRQLDLGGRRCRRRPRRPSSRRHRRAARRPRPVRTLHRSPVRSTCRSRTARGTSARSRRLRASSVSSSSGWSSSASWRVPSWASSARSSARSWPSSARSSGVLCVVGVVVVVAHGTVNPVVVSRIETGDRGVAPRRIAAPLVGVDRVRPGLQARRRDQGIDRAVVRNGHGTARDLASRRPRCAREGTPRPPGSCTASADRPAPWGEARTPCR